MVKTKQYLIQQFLISTFPILLTLFIITSIIFLVKIASLTSVIQINIFEFLELFSYMVPHIIFYTLPISFFMGMIITLSKLSSESELILLSSLGLSPIKIMKFFLPVSILTSIFLLIISLGVMPKTKYMNSIFIAQKKAEITLNIKESEFGQKIGEWLIYINKKSNKEFNDIIMFRKSNNSNEFIIGKKAYILNENQVFQFNILNGSGFISNDNSIKEIIFEKMIIKNGLDFKNNYSYIDSLNYWMEYKNSKKRLKYLILYTLVSLFPTISLFFVLYLGYINPRYDKNHSTLKGLITIIIFYSLIIILTKEVGLNTILIIPIMWLLISYLLYSTKTKRLY